MIELFWKPHRAITAKGASTCTRRMKRRTLLLSSRKLLLRVSVCVGGSCTRLDTVYAVLHAVELPVAYVPRPLLLVS